MNSMTGTPAFPFAPWVPKGSMNAGSKGLSALGRHLAPIHTLENPLSSALGRIWYPAAVASGSNWHRGQGGSKPNHGKRRKGVKIARKLQMTCRSKLGLLGIACSRLWFLYWGVSSATVSWCFGTQDITGNTILKKCILFFFPFLVNKAAVWLQGEDLDQFSFSTKWFSLIHQGIELKM